MDWINVKDELPSMVCLRNVDPQPCFVLAYHTTFGVGVAWFYDLSRDNGHHELEEEYGDKYIGSCSFIKSQEDGNYEIASEEEIDIFEHSPHFRNLGTVTHWMPLPADPPGESKQARDRRVYATPKD